jgi:hypothetical protein
MRLGEQVQKVRSKNAGPFWLTIDIFCGSADAFQNVSARLDNAGLANWFAVDLGTIKRFDMADLNVIKISMPRPVIQGHINDRDMHGAAWAAHLAEMEL